jgi:Predicted integral membrane protein (DUF2269)
VDTYLTVKYIHLLSLFIGLGAGAVLLACLFQLRAAATLEQAVPWGMMAGKVSRLFPVAVVGLFATGAYMTQDVWTWSTRWIDVSIAGLVVIAIQGPVVAERTAHKLQLALQKNGPGPIGEDARRMTRHPGLWVVEFTNLALVMGVVWNMTQKPGVWESIAAVVIAYAVGVFLAVLCMRAPAAALQPAPTASDSA